MGHSARHEKTPDYKGYFPTVTPSQNPLTFGTMNINLFLSMGV